MLFIFTGDYKGYICFVNVMSQPYLQLREKVLYCSPISRGAEKSLKNRLRNTREPDTVNTGVGN